MGYDREYLAKYLGFPLPSRMFSNVHLETLHLSKRERISAAIESYDNWAKNIRHGEPGADQLSFSKRNYGLNAAHDLPKYPTRKVEGVVCGINIGTSKLVKTFDMVPCVGTIKYFEPSTSFFGVSFFCSIIFAIHHQTCTNVSVR